MLVAVAWVDMPDTASAQALQELADVPGSGNVTELNRERGRYRDVQFTGTHYASNRDGATVVIAQAEPVGRIAVARDLAELASEAASSGSFSYPL